MASKQRPSVLVTDARQRPPQRRVLQRQDTGAGAGGSQAPMRFMTVDNVLQYNSQIPSGQPRGPPAPVPPGRHPGPAGGAISRRVSSGGLPNAQSRTGMPMPSRTTKISEKLVLLPETGDNDDDVDEEIESESVLARRVHDDENRPLKDEELDVLKKRGGIRGKSFAERLSKMQRTDKVSRLTAYCTAQAYKIKPTAEFLRKKHEAKTKIYDDCLYVIYALPLLNGTDGYRVRSRPILKTPGTGKTVLDLEIERSEQRDHHEGYFEDDAYENPSPERGHEMPSHLTDRPSTPERSNPFRHDDDVSSMNRLAPDAKNFAEMFVYSYGVVVFWNFTEHQEKDILADLTFADADATENGATSLLTRPLDQEDYETEEFHFEYSADIKRPRIFNDMITLLPRSDHMIKLTISHAIAQSTRLCFFEERMSETMISAQHVPKTLALTGELNMTRTEIVRMLGQLFKSRVDINLSSNILDVPNFFWDSEPTLHPLYAAIREYLEIDPRIKVLNERCRVFLDLAEILSDSVADAKMSYITWIIIVLIIVSIMVTVTEVAIRFGMLSKAKGTGIDPAIIVPALGDGVSGQGHVALPPSDLEILAQTLGLQSNASFDDVQQGILALKKKTLPDASIVHASHEDI
ncbi:sporulation RMD8 [Fusarium circinatum]|uniref:Sporulation RMD8 n=1 Tax=Fusarium circinatum TaxID=48490 RepID=A0A8H5T9A9_FUSCI|nr:sporulation RMD8 [Fusarium circinatum]